MLAHVSASRVSPRLKQRAELGLRIETDGELPLARPCLLDDANTRGPLRSGQAFTSLAGLAKHDSIGSLLN
jgi:hypothetical protein